MRILLLSLIVTVFTSLAEAASICEAVASRGARAVLVALKLGHATKDLPLSVLREFSQAKDWYNPYEQAAREPETLALNRTFSDGARGLSRDEQEFVRGEIAKYVALKSQEEIQVDKTRDYTAKLLYPRYLYQFTSEEMSKAGPGTCYMTPFQIDGTMAVVGQCRAASDKVNRTFIVRPFDKDPARRVQIVARNDKDAELLNIFVKDGVPYATLPQTRFLVDLKRGVEIPNPSYQPWPHAWQNTQSVWSEGSGSLKRYAIIQKRLYEFDDFNPHDKPRKLLAADYGLRVHRIGEKDYLTMVKFTGETPDRQYFKRTILVVDPESNRALSKFQVISEQEGPDELSDVILYENDGHLHLNFRVGTKHLVYTTYDVNLKTKDIGKYPSEFDILSVPRQRILVNGKPFAHYQTGKGFAFEDLLKRTVEVNTNVGNRNTTAQVFTWRNRKYWLMAGNQEVLILDFETRDIVGRNKIGASGHFVYPFAHEGDVYGVAFDGGSMPHLILITSEVAPK